MRERDTALRISEPLTQFRLQLSYEEEMEPVGVAGANQRIDEQRHPLLRLQIAEESDETAWRRHVALTPVEAACLITLRQLPELEVDPVGDHMRLDAPQRGDLLRVHR